jgi:hypothetical protein
MCHHKTPLVENQVVRKTLQKSPYSCFEILRFRLQLLDRYFQSMRNADRVPGQIPQELSVVVS